MCVGWSVCVTSSFSALLLHCSIDWIRDMQKTGETFQKPVQDSVLLCWYARSSGRKPYGGGYREHFYAGQITELCMTSHWPLAVGISFHLVLYCETEECPTRQDNCVTLETSSYPWIICSALLPFFGAFSQDFLFHFSTLIEKYQFLMQEHILLSVQDLKVFNLLLLPSHCSPTETAIIAVVWKK